MKNLNLQKLRSFKIIPEFSLYRIREDGVIYSYKSGKFLKPIKQKNGYYCVFLYNGHGKRKQKYLHKLVANLFLNNPLNLKMVNHKDGNKKDCTIGNIEWTTYLENNRHAKKLGLNKNIEENHYHTNFNYEDIKNIRRLKGELSQEKIAKLYEVTRSCIQQIHRGITWKSKKAFE